MTVLMPAPAAALSYAARTSRAMTSIGCPAHAPLAGYVSSARAHAAACLERHVVIESRLLGEGLEQCRHSADALVVEIGDRVSSVEANRGARAEDEAVAHEQQALAACGNARGTQRQNQAREQCR